MTLVVVIFEQTLYSCSSSHLKITSYNQSHTNFVLGVSFGCDFSFIFIHTPVPCGLPLIHKTWGTPYMKQILYKSWKGNKKKTWNIIHSVIKRLAFSWNLLHNMFWSRYLKQILRFQNKIYNIVKETQNSKF